MNPAYSVIFFTVSSGAGYGLLLWLSFAMVTGTWMITPAAGLTGSIIALVLVTAGLLSSTFHLGHPERAWRAFTQWKSSWLSREGVLAVLTYPPALIFTAGWVTDEIGVTTTLIAAFATIVLSLATIISTGMIYASLKPVPAWHNGWAVPAYLGMGLASGGLLFAVIVAASGETETRVAWPVLMVLLLAWGIKLGYWRYVDTAKPGSDSGTATGLGNLGDVKLFEGPHTSENYVMKEMGFRVARKHAGKLRRLTLILGVMVPAVLLALAAALGGPIDIVLLGIGVVPGLFAVLVERWLFFAEARHVVTLYY